MSDDQPRLELPRSKTDAMIVQAATANDSAMTTTPSWVARRNGRSEKLVRPSSARRGALSS